MQAIFKRNEEKYLMTQTQANQLINAMSNHMKPDDFGTYWVQNLYFDTENWDIINNSMEKPFYKEKVRLRCYGMPEAADFFFLEIKKKYSGVVYKRRLSITPADIMNHSLEEVLSKDNSQIAKELKYHIQKMGVKEKFFLAYYRQAFVSAGMEDDGLRLTIDSNISYRLDMLHFTQPQLGCAALDSNTFLLEIKTPLSIPLWLVRILDELEIFPSSFSKYATCFTDWIGQSKKVALSQGRASETSSVERRDLRYLIGDGNCEGNFLSNELIDRKVIEVA